MNTAQLPTPANRPLEEEWTGKRTEVTAEAASHNRRETSLRLWHCTLNRFFFLSESEEIAKICSSFSNFPKRSHQTRVGKRNYKNTLRGWSTGRSHGFTSRALYLLLGSGFEEIFLFFPPYPRASWRRPITSPVPTRPSPPLCPQLPWELPGLTAFCCRVLLCWSFRVLSVFEFNQHFPPIMSSLL